VVLQVIAKHGGMVDGQLPPLSMSDLELRNREVARQKELAIQEEESEEE
jgi:hypothetical protein